MNNPYEPPRDISSFEPEFGMEQGGKLTLLQIFFTFDGRIPRKVYWLASLFSTFMLFVYAFCIGIFGAMITGGAMTESTINMLLLPGYLVMLWTHLAIQIKRWHDRGKSGSWIFINFVPCVGGIIGLVETGFQRGDFGLNQYGPDPTDMY
jgi:uncharacterized membrane protein YhaH (DUF805 family)